MQRISPSIKSKIYKTHFLKVKFSSFGRGENTNIFMFGISLTCKYTSDVRWSSMVVKNSGLLSLRQGILLITSRHVYRMISSLIGFEISARTCSSLKYLWVKIFNRINFHYILQEFNFADRKFYNSRGFDLWCFIGLFFQATVIIIRHQHPFPGRHRHK